MTERKSAFPLPRSLDAKMIYMLLLSLLLAAAVYLTTYGLGTLALQKIYMSPESVAARQAKIYADFSAYVSSHQIAGTDEAAVASWPGNDAYTTILIYRDEDLAQAAVASWPGNDAYTTILIYRDEHLAQAGGLRPAANSGGYAGGSRLQYASEYGRLYPMRFSDGVYHIAIGDSSDVREDTLNRLISVVLAAIAFLGAMLWFIRRLTRRVIRLSREADVIGEGDLEAPITLSGEDELSQLAREVDAMRRSVIQRMSGEREAWEANSELITAISHDIRTPMTSLIGYLDLLNEDGFRDPERSARFASSAYQKAMELKDLTDELFKYFLVFGRASVEMNREELDGRLLLEQLLGEAQFDLSDAGFEIRRQDFEGECRLSADPLYLKRVMDNLVSNLKKYADRAQPVLLLSALRDGKLTVSVSNGIREDLSRVESTKIGLRTCEKILRAMDGSFVITKDDSGFTASFSLPVL